jgi:hypothetical protein
MPDLPVVPARRSIAGFFRGKELPANIAAQVLALRVALSLIDEVRLTADFDDNSIRVLTVANRGEARASMAATESPESVNILSLAAALIAHARG